MTKRNPEQEPEPTEALSVDPDTMAAPDQAEIGRLQALRDAARDDDAVRHYDEQITAIADKYRT